MGGEDWPEPLPEGWVLKTFSDGQVWAHNTKTGQTFHTKKDLLRYVHYAETILPLFANRMIPYNDDQATSDSKGKAIDDNAGDSDDGEGNSKQASDGEDSDLEDNGDNSLYGGIDFSRGIWSVDVEIIERSNPQPERKKVVKDDQHPKRKTKVQDDEQSERKMKIDEQPKMKMETKSGTEHVRNKKVGPRKKFEMPPKRFRGLGSGKKHRHKP